MNGSFYKSKDDIKKRAAAEILETASHFSSVSKIGRTRLADLPSSKLMARAKSNSGQSDMKVYMPVGYRKNLNSLVSKDANS
jgi:hypothetical protein